MYHITIIPLYLHQKCSASTYQEFIKYNVSMKKFSDSKDIIRRNNILFNYILTDQCDHMQLCDIFWREDDYSFLRYHDDEQKARRWIDLTTIRTGTQKKKIRQYQQLFWDNLHFLLSNLYSRWWCSLGC